MAASINETRKAIDTALSSTGYSCKTVSWDDVSRGTVDGTLSCWGSNITDTRLNAKDGTSLFTVRSDNWNEKLGHVDSAHIALLVGNCDEPRGEGLRNVTLRDFLDSPLYNGASYTGLESDTKLSCAERDTKVSIRFQTVFLPVDDSGKLQFATEAYSYGTVSDDDPRNLVCLSTTQGLSVQADGAGSKRLFLHKRNKDGELGEYWLEAEASRHKVGGEQRESKEEREDAIARGKATSEVIGIKAMGKRFNVLMTIQVPLEQSKPKRDDYPMMFACSAAPAMEGAMYFLNIPSPVPLARSAPSHMRRREVKKGISRAARVSRGDYNGPYERISITAPKRNAAEHVTVTCVLYNTVMDGVPTAADCIAAVEDMERLYAACSETGRLADATFGFMKSELTVSDMVKIDEKLTKQPPLPPPKPDSVLSPAPLDGHGLVRAKVAEIEMKGAILEEDVLMLKLLTLGALKDSDTKKLLAKKFDSLKTAAAVQKNKEASQMFVELRQLIAGAFGK